MRTKVIIAVAFLGILNPGSTFAAECEDSDGDGWGWDGVATCTVPVSPTAPTIPATAPITDPALIDGVCIDSDGDGWGWDGENTCALAVQPTVTPTSIDGACIDSDGDGWGWNGEDTCTVPVPPTTNPMSVAGACIDSDGDGWGWDGVNTCAIAVTSGENVPGEGVPEESAPLAGACVDSNGDGWGWNGIETCVVAGPEVPPGITDNITDVVLMMGQSNALGEDTLVDAGLDAPDDSVIAWTQFEGWQVANLCTQKWQKAWFPWRGGVCSNHPAFQIAKRIVEKDPGRRVAVIPTGTAGKPIRWWDANGIADNLVNVQVTTALAALGHDKVDLIAWSQGESDHGNEAEWALKLEDLIIRLRQRSWFDAATGQFIAQETKWSTVNSKVRELSNDGDPLTKWVPAADQPTKDGVHWSGAALRVVSDRYANEYLY